MFEHLAPKRKEMKNLSIAYIPANVNNGNTILLNLVEEAGATFVPVNGKKPLGANWQKSPQSAKQVSRHGKHCNIGLLTGKPSQNIIAIDIDEDGETFLAQFKHLATTMQITRSDATHRVKVFFQVSDDLPRSASWRKKGKSSPSAELLSTGRQGVIWGTHAGGAQYAWNGCMPAPITFAQLSSIWRLWTGSELQKPNRVRATERISNNLYAIAAKAHWDCLKVFRHFGMAERVVEGRDEKKLRGNGGLFIKKDDSEFFCHSAQIGGDAVAAWHYAKHSSAIEGKDEFVKTCKEMLEAIGQSLPFVARDLGFDPGAMLMWAANPQNYPKGTKSIALRAIFLAVVKTAIGAHKSTIGFSVRDASEKAGVSLKTAICGLRNLVALGFLERIHEYASHADAYSYSIAHLATRTEGLSGVNPERMDPTVLVRYADCDSFQHGVTVKGTILRLGRASLDIIAALSSKNDRTLAETAEATLRSASTCAERLKVLVRLGIVEEWRDGKRCRYYLVGAWEDILEPTMERTIKRKIRYALDRILRARKILSRNPFPTLAERLTKKIDQLGERIALLTSHLESKGFM